MDAFRKFILASLILSISSVAIAQTDEKEALKVTALEALISAPPERALPIVTKVLRGDSSADLKERALFVLSQIDLPEAQTLLVETAQTGNEDIRLEAIRMIGIGGDRKALDALGAIYAAGDGDTKEAVLEAYLIADDNDAVYQIAANTQDPDEFEDAVSMLGAMGATEELRTLRDRPDMGEVLIDAYAVAGDVESLTALATDSSNPERQAQALHGLGIAGGDEVGDVLVDVYRNTDMPKVKDAALEGLMIAGLDQAVLELFNESKDAAEKRELMETLVMMDSDAVWDLIDTTLENGQ
ncbi:MAG: HEAT repeat domain-containing protein [Woeseiaceae bacterium]